FDRQATRQGEGWFGIVRWLFHRASLGERLDLICQARNQPFDTELAFAIRGGPAAEQVPLQERKDPAAAQDFIRQGFVRLARTEERLEPQPFPGTSLGIDDLARKGAHGFQTYRQRTGFVPPNEL